MKYALTAALVFGFAGIAFAADGSQFVIIKDKISIAASSSRTW